MSNPDGIIGRAVGFSWNGAAVLGTREKDLTLNGAPINVTSDENSGKQTLLSVSEEDSVEVKLTGVTKSDVLKTDWFAGTRTRAVVLTYPNGASIAGNFFMSVFSEKGPYKDAVAFDATLMSTGAVTFTPGTGF